MASTSLQHVTEDPVTDDSGVTLEEMRERVSARGRSVAAAVDALGGEIREAADWRTHAARHPYWAIGAAATMGLVAASLLRRKRAFFRLRQTAWKAWLADCEGQAAPRARRGVEPGVCCGAPGASWLALLYASTSVAAWRLREGSIPGAPRRTAGKFLKTVDPRA
jgi:ElaB/YqjD/DUF883 family membrane-anchored ribosome-binding protein